MTRDIVWVDDQVKLCQNIYTNFMWGKDYERLRAEAEELEVIFMSLVNFSETRLEKITMFNRKWPLRVFCHPQTLPLWIYC